MLLLPSGFLALLDLCDALHRTAPRPDGIRILILPPIRCLESTELRGFIGFVPRHIGLFRVLGFSSPRPGSVLDAGDAGPAVSGLRKSVS